jgi:hypothetical protein
MSAFSVDFSTQYSPRIVGGLQDMPSTPGMVAHLECYVCQKAVGILFGEVDCDAECIGVVEAAGGGPEDPVADFVAAVCPAICNKILNKVESTTEQVVCQAVNMCSASS